MTSLTAGKTDALKAKYKDGKKKGKIMVHLCHPARLSKQKEESQHGWETVVEGSKYGQREGDAGESQPLQVSWKSFSSVRRFCSAMCIWFSRSWGQADAPPRSSEHHRTHTGGRDRTWGLSILATLLLTRLIYRRCHKRRRNVTTDSEDLA